MSTSRRGFIHKVLGSLAVVRFGVPAGKPVLAEAAGVKCHEQWHFEYTVEVEGIWVGVTTPGGYGPLTSGPIHVRPGDTLRVHIPRSLCQKGVIPQLVYEKASLPMPLMRSEDNPNYHPGEYYEEDDE